MDLFGEESGFVLKVFFEVFFDGFLGLDAEEVFLAPGDEFFPGEGDLVDAELVSVEEFGQYVEVLDFVLLEVFEFLEVVLAGVGVVETVDGVGVFGVGKGVLGEVGWR